MRKISFDISGQVAVVTGAGGILCSVLARQLVEQGVLVALLDIDGEKVQKLADEIVAEGGGAMAVQVDVLDKQSVQEACGKVMERFGTVDILINGAGGNKAAATTSPELPFFDLTDDAINWVFNLNLVGTILPTQVFGKVMAQNGKGNIINISSMAAFKPLTRTMAYSAAKAGISNFTQWMAVHFAQEYSPNIRVNAIAPGFLLTQQNYYLLVDKDTGERTPRGDQILGGTPMGRYGEPEELVGAVVYLCSEAASFVTGIVLPIDGGFSAYPGV
ncbi:MAG: SDR family oxidoreductase [Christensenellales bacterium]|jgi:NAD(P)-dependent dehydrogenase (short-subunit alcohol dehydrogenase family)